MSSQSAASYHDINRQTLERYRELRSRMSAQERREFGAGGGANDFLDLNDTPSSYSGAGSAVVYVGTAGTALLFGPVLPATSGTVVLRTATQTLTNKTLDAPTFTSRATGQAFRSFSTGSIGDDGVYSFAPFPTSGMLLINSTSGGGVRPDVQALVAYRYASGLSAIMRIIAQPSTAIETTGNTDTVLTGTTGTDGVVTISSSPTNGLLYIENRTGANITINVTVFG